MITSVCRRMATLTEMLTPFDDAAIVSFLRSMPYGCRRRIALSSVGMTPILLCGISLIPLGLAMGLFFRWAGASFCEPNAASICGFFVSAINQGLVLTIYRNVQLRKWFTRNSLDGQLLVCPSCFKEPIDNQEPNCECGCLLRLLSKTDQAR